MPLPRKFMNEVDSAGVFHNRFHPSADGFQAGLGAELGIIIQQPCPRPDVGLEGLTTYKYKLYGNGHTVAEYNKGEKTFKHKPIQ